MGRVKCLLSIKGKRGRERKKTLRKKIKLSRVFTQTDEERETWWNISVCCVLDGSALEKDENSVCLNSSRSLLFALTNHL